MTSLGLNEDLYDLILTANYSFCGQFEVFSVKYLYFMEQLMVSKQIILVDSILKNLTNKYFQLSKYYAVIQCNAFEIRLLREFEF